MKLNNKGFAITSIIYSMLILFLTLVVLIIGNLASRKAVFDKQKEDILNKINGPEDTIAKLCTYQGTDKSKKNEYGAEYSCILGDGETRIFYLLENNEDSENVSLIMDSNIGELVAWNAGCSETACDTSLGPVTALPYLQSQTENWGVTVTMPTIDQIVMASDATEFVVGMTIPSWLWTNINDGTNSALPSGYWIQEPYTVYINGTTKEGILSTMNVWIAKRGVRPVITILKEQIG